MDTIDKINKLINSIDTKGQVTIKIIEDKHNWAPGCVLIRLELIDNSLCCDLGINIEKFDAYYNINKEALNKKVRLLTEECYRNNDCL